MRILFVLIFSVLFVSCQKKASQETEQQPSTAFEVLKENFFANLRSPERAAAALELSGAEFNAALLNDTAQWHNYITSEPKAAANLGVYLADLNYCIAYHQPAFSKGYFKASQELAATIGVQKEVLGALMKRYQANLDQNDSVKSVVASLYANATSNLRDTQREGVAGIVYSAYQIENLHLALGLINTFPKDLLPNDSRNTILAPVFRVVLTQKENVTIIHQYLQSIGDPEKQKNYVFYTNAFLDLIGTYDKLNVEEKIKNNQGAELVNDAVAQELAQKVDTIRQKVVSHE